MRGSLFLGIDESFNLKFRIATIIPATAGNEMDYALRSTVCEVTIIPATAGYKNALDMV